MYFYSFYTALRLQKITIVLIDKGVHLYWFVIEAGVKRAEQELRQKFGADITTIFFTSTSEEAYLQVFTS